MNNALKIGMVAGSIVAIIVVVMGLNLYAVNNLQFRGSSDNNFNNFDFADMSMDVKFNACNPTFFPASFNNLKVNITYKTTDFGTFTIYGKTVPPQSSTDVTGRLKLNGVAIAGLFLEILKSSFSHQSSNLDPTQLHYITTLDAPILGVIPFSISKTFSPTEFWEMVRGQVNNYQCS